MIRPRDFFLPAARRAWTRELLAPIDETQWNDLARELFAWQYAHVRPYQCLCRAHGVTPDKLNSWRNIPAVPQQLFKHQRLFGHGSIRPSAIYETSGTTTGQPGRQHLLRSDLYRTMSVEGAKRAGLFQTTPSFHFLVPSPTEAPHSSLSAMFGFWQKAFAPSASSNPNFYFRRNCFEFARLRQKLLAQSKARRPIALCGTALSFVHLLDAWADFPPLPLPPGSWLLETGGFKGRGREISKADLYAQLARTFSLRDEAIWNEYGMSELSSQSYAHGTDGLHVAPPWARVLVCDPASGREVRVGHRGLIRWIDLANVDSVMALQTLDVAERTPQGFHLLGRLPRTEPRGCSLSTDDINTG